MDTMDRPCRIFAILLLVTISSLTGHAQGTNEDPIGFKGGYKALSRLCEANLAGAAQLLVSNNVGFNVPGSPDLWPESAEGVWIHPICPMVPGRAPRVPTPSAPPSGTAAVPDSTASSGIYLTQADFDAGIMTYASSFPIEEKDLISWTAVSYISYSNTVRVRTSATAREYKEFPRGSLFGFRSNIISYIYLKAEKSFLPVV